MTKSVDTHIPNTNETLISIIMGIRLGYIDNYHNSHD